MTFPAPITGNSFEALKAAGFAAIRYTRTMNLVEQLGVETAEAPSWGWKYRANAGKGRYTGNRWAKRWLVQLCEAEPCNIEARAQLIEKLRAGGPPAAELRAALEALDALTSDSSRFATFIMEQWEP